MLTKLIYFLYRVSQAAVFPLILLYLLWRGLKDRRYLSHLQERFGFLPPSYQRTDYGSIWLHAVSVGEVLSALEMVRRLHERQPDTSIFISCATVAGRAVAREKLADLVQGVFYVPLDYCFSIRRVLRTIHPAVVVVLETEIWPNLFREVKRAGCGLLIVNGRISNRAFPRYRRYAWFFRHVLQHADQILVQTDEDGQRYRVAGAPPDLIRMNGNLKFDASPRVSEIPPNLAAWFEAEQGPIWIAASTMPPAHERDLDEDDIVIDIYRRLRSQIAGLRLILAPRKPERFDVVARKLSDAGVEHVRRSNGRGNAAVLLLDSIGELSSLFARADVVFVGGSLADRGGHNVLEPAFFGVPIIVGQHLENFAGIASAFASKAAMVQVPSAPQLEAALTDLLRDKEKRRMLGARGREAADSERGATDRTLLALDHLQSEFVQRALPYGPLRLPGRLMSAAWLQGGRWKRSRDLKRQKALPAPVISVGGIAIGGSGKTPFVAFLAGLLKAQGYRVAILTRGYGRSSPEKELILKAGSAAPARMTGDEAQIFLRDGNADVGIGADRWRTGMKLYRQFKPDLYLLDDGFQHARLKRDLDLVLLDGLDPFAGDALVPLGRLREPVAALSRADVVVVSRTETLRSLRALEDRVRRFSAASIMRVETAPQFWMNLNSGGKTNPEAVGGKLVAAFCGLANPASFWRTLAALGFQPVMEWTFGDHHRYSCGELNRMATEARERGAEVLLTTEKDAANLPLDTVTHIAPLKLMWLKISVELVDKDSLIELIKSKMASQS